MGTWSITPNNGLASIDANSGVATFKEHTSDTTYTIHFSDSTCTGGEVTKTFMVFACSQPTCVCSAFSATTSGTRVPSATTSTEYIVGRYTAATNCTDSISIALRTGTDFLTGLRASGGNIYAKVAVANTGSERSSTYFVRQGGCEDYFTAYQSSGTTPSTCTCNDLKVSGDKTIDSSSRSNFEIGTYTAGCVTNITVSEPADWITSISASNGSIKASVNENTSTTNTRATEITVTGRAGSNTCTKSFTLTQNPKSETCTCSSSNFSVTGMNVDTSGGNAVLIANFTSECEPSLSFENYAGETFIDYSMTSSTYDSSTKKGKIYAKVPQNTASSDRMEQVGVYINGETDFCKHFAVTQKGQVPESWSINLRIANNDSEYHCINDVEIFLDGFSTSIQTAQGECVNAGGEENLGTVSFPNSASAPEGATITRIEAVVNDGSGAGTIKTLTTNNSILRNGSDYLFTLPAS